jgi:lipopolysaccharide export system protein LptC
MSAPASRAQGAPRDRGFAVGVRAQAGAEDTRLRAFRSARSHSRLVRILRVAAPTSLVLAVALLVLGALFNPFRNLPGDVSFSSLGIDGMKITMGKPKLTGVRQDGRAYVVNAAKAIQDVTRPTMVELREIDGELGMADNQTVHITAAIGFYDSVKQTLDVSQDVRIHNANYDVRLDSASVDFKNGVYKSDKPVTVVMSNGTTISGDSALARNNGEELTFDGHVRSLFKTDDRESAAAEMKGSNP